MESVSLKDAIALALENNPGIAAQRLEPVRQGEGILRSQAQYDPIASAEVQESKSITPNASSLSGTRTLNIDDRFANFHLFKTFRTSTSANLDFLNDRLDNNATFQQLRPQYKPVFALSVVQPLLQNFGWDFSYLVVKVAEQTAEASFYTYKAQLTDFVELVIEAYWNIVGARENLEVQRESKALADRTTKENEARVRVGLLPPVAVLEAQADAASREEQVIIAENTLAVARQQLAQIAFYRPDGTFVPRTLEPVEEAAPEEVTVDLDETLTNALAERPEIQASAHGVTAQVLTERIAGNALLPRLDLVGSYGQNGLSGTNRPFARPSTIISQTDLTNSPQFPGAKCEPLPSGHFLCFINVTNNSQFSGSVGDAYNRLTSTDFYSYSFGLQFQVPLSNAQARSNLADSRIARDQAELNHRQLLSTVTLQVRQSVADLTAARQRIDTTRVARELAEENLKNQTKRHEVGMATTKDLLDFQTRLTTARAAEVQAKIDYATAIARWRRAKGELLAHYQVVLDQPGRGSAPWFARF
ncbi:MAG TPA: TolC family protein [Candidatus Nitrosopolaris sp.]|nr:TolC family protein [Candidatus Nitrosopolaris sp.]